jgi:hypothetical protein
MSLRFETRLSGTLTVRREGDFFLTDFPAKFVKNCTTLPDELFSALGPGSIPSHVLEGDETYIAVSESEGLSGTSVPILGGWNSFIPMLWGLLRPEKKQISCHVFLLRAMVCPKIP